MFQIRTILLARKWIIPLRKLQKHSAEQIVRLQIDDTQKPCSQSSAPTLRMFLNELECKQCVDIEDLKRILSLLQSDGQLKNIDVNALLRCCNNENIQQTDVVDEIWVKLKEKSVSLNIHHYNALLRIYAEKKKHFDPCSMFNEMISCGVTLNALTCNLLMSCCAQQADANSALHLMDRMKEHGISVDESLYNHLILAFANAGNVLEMNEKFEAMKLNGLRGNNDTFTNLLKGYAEVGDVDKLNETLDLYNAENVQLLNADILNVIAELDANDHTDAIDGFYNRLFKSIELRYSAKEFIENAVQNRRFHLVETLLARNADKCSSSLLAQYYLSAAVAIGCDESEIDRIWNYLNTLHLTVDTCIEIYFPAALRSSSVALIRASLCAMKAQALPIRSKHLIQLCQLAGASSPNAIFDALKFMRFELHFQPPCSMIRDVILPHCDYVEQPELIMAKLLAHGINFARISTAMITRYILDGRLSDALRVANAQEVSHLFAGCYRPYFIESLQSSTIATTEDIQNFVAFLHILHDAIKHFRGDIKSLKLRQKADEQLNDREQLLMEWTTDNVQMNEVEVISEIIFATIGKMGRNYQQIEELLTCLFAEGLNISKAYAMEIEQKLDVNSADSHWTHLLNRLSTNVLTPKVTSKKTKSAQPIQLLSSHELSTLAENCGGNTSTSKWFKRYLCLAYIRENNWMAAEDQLQDESVRESVRVHSDLISLHLNRRADGGKSADYSRIDKALDVYEHARKHCSKFNLSPSHASHVIALLLLAGHTYDDIQQMMHRRGITHNFDYDDMVTKHVLREITQSTDVDRTAGLVPHLIDNNYIRPTARSCYAIVKFHLDNDNVDAALSDFQTIQRKYEFTPYTLDLFSKLIERDDLSRLEQLFDLVAEARGKHRALRWLAYAYIQNNRLDQAAVILSNDILMDGGDFFEKDCKYLYDHNRINILEGLLHATHKLDYKRAPIYQFIFLQYCKANQERRATDVFQKKNEENIEPLLAADIKETIAEIELPPAREPDKNVPDITALDVADGVGEIHEWIESALAANEHIDPTVLSLYLNEVTEAGNTDIFDKLWTYSSVRAMPNVGELFLHVYLNGPNPMRYIKRLNQLIEDANACMDPQIHAEQLQEVESVIGFDEHLVLLQQYPHAIAEYERVANKAANSDIYSPINVIWLYHFLSHSPFIENLWTQHFVEQPEHFDTENIRRILETQEHVGRLNEFDNFLRAMNAVNVQTAICKTKRKSVIETTEIK